MNQKNASLFRNWRFGGCSLILGLGIAIQAIFSREWIGIIFGGYFASMGLFGFGCAGGNCGIK
jgi:hypothetical protein